MISRRFLLFQANKGDMTLNSKTITIFATYVNLSIFLEYRASDTFGRHLLAAQLIDVLL